MRKLLLLAVTIISTASLMISCTKKDDMPEKHSQLVTILDGSWDTGNFTVKFDDNKTAYVENSSKFFISGSSYLNGETRAMITFHYAEGQQKEGFDHTITITELFPLPTSYLKHLEESGIANIEEYDTGINIDSGFFANGYVNIAIRYKSSPEMGSKHSVKLVYNTDIENSPYKDLYKADDKYLYLELYHDNKNDAKTSEYSIYQCYKLIPENLAIDNYKGIKVLYKSEIDGEYKNFSIVL